MVKRCKRRTPGAKKRHDESIRESLKWIEACLKNATGAMEETEINEFEIGANSKSVTINKDIDVVSTLCVLTRLGLPNDLQVAITADLLSDEQIIKCDINVLAQSKIKRNWSVDLFRFIADKDRPDLLSKLDWTPYWSDTICDNCTDVWITCAYSSLSITEWIFDNGFKLCSLHPNFVDYIILNGRLDLFEFLIEWDFFPTSHIINKFINAQSAPMYNSETAIFEYLLTNIKRIENRANRCSCTEDEVAHCLCNTADFKVNYIYPEREIIRHHDLLEICHREVGISHECFMELCEMWDNNENLLVLSSLKKIKAISCRNHKMIYYHKSGHNYERIMKNKNLHEDMFSLIYMYDYIDSLTKKE